jgi:hypothetical protein
MPPTLAQPPEAAGPASPCPARRRTYSRCGRESWPTPSPVVISSSPPSSHGVGSGSSETWTQRITLAAPPAPAASSSPRPGSAAMSRTVSIVSCAALGRAGQDATSCAGSEASICGIRSRATNASLRHDVEEERQALARPSIALRSGHARESPECLFANAQRPMASSRRAPATSREASRLRGSSSRVPRGLG